MFAYRDKKVVSVFVRFSCAASVNIALWGSESWALKKNRSKLEAFHHDVSADVRADVGCSEKRIRTNAQREWLQTHPRWKR
jgi:hypothetical protein